MDALRQAPLFAFDHETRKQIRETRVTLLEHLRADPDDFKALVLADVIGELDPDRDVSISQHRMRFRATRPADWKVRARELGLDRVLFHLAQGMARANMGRDAIPILERRAIEISEARPPEVTRGHIDASRVPAELAGVATFHPNGHLASVAIYIDRLHEGELVLDATPGSGAYRIVEKRGGYGTMIREEYRDGRVITTLNSPWHDGEESSERRPWTRWVEECLADLARLRTTAPRPKPKPKPKPRAKRRRRR